MKDRGGEDVFSDTGAGNTCQETLSGEADLLKKGITISPIKERGLYGGKKKQMMRSSRMGVDRPRRVYTKKRRRSSKLKKKKTSRPRRKEISSAGRRRASRVVLATTHQAPKNKKIKIPFRE